MITIIFEKIKKKFQWFSYKQMTYRLPSNHSKYSLYKLNDKQNSRTKLSMYPDNIEYRYRRAQNNFYLVLAACGFFEDWG